jgi:hypothetical protein
LAKRHGVPLRQSYARLGKKALRLASRYAHARQMKRARREIRRLKTYLGRVFRDVRRKLEGRPEVAEHFAKALPRVERLLAQQRTDKNKLYALHAPEVACIAKGKAHKKYEFGAKVSVAVIITTALTAAVLAWYIGSGRSLVRLRFARLRMTLFSDILRVGAVGSISTLQTTLTVALTTALVGAAGGPDAIAGYGTGARLEYLRIPLVFGLGAPLVAMVGTNIGAGEQARALRIAFVGGALAFGITETIGLAAAIWPHAWLGLFGRRCAHAGDRRRLSAQHGAGLRVLRPWPVALLRITRGRPAVLAALRGAAAPAHSSRRRMGRVAPDRLARLAVCQLWRSHSSSMA